MEGAQYMHVEIPDLDVPTPGIVHYILWGSIDAYRQKVYGSGDPDLVVSPAEFLGSHKAWDLRRAYDILWETWKTSIMNLRITQQALDNIIQTNDRVISTIPATTLCSQRENGTHAFDYVPVWIDNLWSGPLPEEQPQVWLEQDSNVVICNGREPNNNLEATGWYRTSHIYGHMNTEWASPQHVPEGRANNGGRIWRVRKPLSTNCDCWPMVVRAGRYGLWRKGVLTHDAFDAALSTLS
jgi:hypothetical protein